MVPIRVPHACYRIRNCARFSCKRSYADLLLFLSLYTLYNIDFLSTLTVQQRLCIKEAVLS